LHASCFTTFVVTSMFYVTLNTYLFDYSGRRRSYSSAELSYQYKIMLMIGAYTSLILALYFYYRHNAYCEPGVYTLFALSEYAFVFINVLYHGTIGLDLHDKHLCLVSVHSFDTVLPIDEQPLIRRDE